MFAYAVIAISCDLWTKGWKRRSGRECGRIGIFGDKLLKRAIP